MSESGASTRAVRGSVSDLGSGRTTPAAEPEAAAIGVYSVAVEIPDEDIASMEPLLGAEKAAEAKEKEKEKVQQMKKSGILGTPVTEDEVRFFFSLLSLLTAFFRSGEEPSTEPLSSSQVPFKKKKKKVMFLHLPAQLYRIASFSVSLTVNVVVLS